MSPLTDPRRRVDLVFDRLPAAAFDEAIGYLRDVWRECQLVALTASSGGRSAMDPQLVGVAAALVPDLEELGDVLEDGQIVPLGDDLVRLEVALVVGQLATLAHLQAQLAQVRLLSRAGALLATAGPEAHDVLSWLWAHAAEQLHGRPPRPYHLGS